MKVITTETEDGFGVEEFVNEMYQRIPAHWQALLPDWYVMIIDHTKTFREVPQLHEILRAKDFNAQRFGKMAEHPGDWWSIRVVIQRPVSQSKPSLIWIRHGEDRFQLGHDFLSCVGCILFFNNTHLQIVWGLAMRKVYGSSLSQVQISDKFCDAFAPMMFDRQLFRAHHSDVLQPMADLDKRIWQGAISRSLD